MTPLLLLLGTASAQDALLVGNSYTAYNGLSGLTAAWLAATAPGGSDPAVESVTAGGKTLAGHAADLDADTALRFHLVTDPLPWRFVTLQDQSQIPGFPDEEPAWIASRDAAVELAQAVRATGADPVFFQTWGRREGDAGNPDLYPDFPTMQDRISAGYASYREAAGDPAWIAPVGEVFRAVHDAEPDEAAVQGTEFWQLYSGDGSHPSLGGTTVIAATFVATWTGRQPEPLALLVDQGLDEARQEVLLAHVRQVVLEDVEGDWPWLRTWEEHDPATPLDGDLQRPTLRVDSDQVAPALTVEDGRVWVLPEGALAVDQLAAGPEAELVLEGVLEGASLELAGLDWRGGTLAFQDAVGDLTIPDSGRLALGAPASLEGSLRGTGTLAWEGPKPAGEVVALSASDLDLSGLSIELPPDTDHAIRGADWVIFPVEVATRGRPGCGCGTAPPPALPALAAIALLVLRRRRESGSPGHEAGPIC